MKILIIGAGIGGLTAAIALRQAGFDVQVFERAAQLKEIGAGIGLSPSAVRVLKRLGLLEAIVERGTSIAAAITHDSQGNILGRAPMDMMDVPSVCLLRADLQQVLLSAWPADRLHLGETFQQFEQSKDGVVAHFASGRAEAGAALIGADGLRSKVRAQLVNDEPPRYRGYQCWRGISRHPASTFLTETFGRGLRMGVVPVGRGGTAWWCTANEGESANDEPNGAKAKLLRLFGQWHRPIPDVLNSTAAEAIIKTGIYDRPSVASWSQGACTLLGDAAHPTTPNLGQGGCMAIEDAVVLARCLAHDPNPTKAFQAYQKLRFARTTKVTKISRCYGIIGQWKNPAGVWLRNTLLRLGSGKGGTRGYMKFVSYDPYEVSL